jgi:hypothetical protein
VTSNLLAAAATIGLLGAGIAGASETRSFEALTSQVAANSEGGSGQCRVDVVRTGTAGAADITRQAFSDGSCVCTVTTGPAGNNGSAEAVVAALLRDRTCSGAPAPAGYGNAAAAGATGGGATGTVVGVVAALTGVAVAAAAGGKKKDSPGG